MINIYLFEYDYILSCFSSFTWQRFSSFTWLQTTAFLPAQCCATAAASAPSRSWPTGSGRPSQRPSCQVPEFTSDTRVHVNVMQCSHTHLKTPAYLQWLFYGTFTYFWDIDIMGWFFMGLRTACEEADSKQCKRLVSQSSF